MRNILIFRTGAIGDTLLLYPFVRELERRYPEAILNLVGAGERVRLLASQFRHGRGLDFERDFSWLFLDDGAGSSDIRELLVSQDWIINFSANTNDRMERRLKSLGVKRLDTIPALPSSDRQRHALFHPFDALGFSYAVETLLAEAPFQPSPEVEEAANLADAVDLLDVKPLIFFPGAGSSDKCWRLENWLILLVAIRQVFHGSVICIAGPAEERREMVEFLDRLPPEVTVARGLSLRTLAALLSKGVAFVGNDSGVTHLASLLGIPTLALFGSTHPGVWGPIGCVSSILWGKQMISYPDWIVESLPNEKRSMDAIQPEAILNWLAAVR